MGPAAPGRRLAGMTPMSVIGAFQRATLSIIEGSNCGGSSMFSPGGWPDQFADLDGAKR